MPTLQLSLHLLTIILAGILAEPDPGRIPKVYNALITSNQNLEPSKAYPVYQPVLHDAAFTFPFHPAFYYGREIPLTNGLVPLPAQGPYFAQGVPTLAPAAPAAPVAPGPAPETPPEPKDAPATDNSESENKSPTSPPPPPNTESPIPLNEFGLPPQVLPLSKVDPYRGFNQVVPFSYSYPGFRFYDPYDPYNFNPYLNFPPVYRPLTNEFNQGAPAPVPESKAVASPAASAPEPDNSATPPPSDSSDLNVLNYASKDPAIPNVPPPPLPQGGLKSDKDE